MAVRSLTYISLCTGGGGLDLGIELAMPAARPVCFVEREAFACARLVAAMQDHALADAPLWSDVTTFNGRPWRGLVDGIVGGIPCQPHSLAGRRRGAADERDLWSDARRILVQSGAWFILIENVGGILTSGGAERLFRDLSRLGFASEAGLFTAAEVGDSHRRERLFWLAAADRDRAERRSQSDEHGHDAERQETPSGVGMGSAITCGAMAHTNLPRSPQPGSQRSDPRPQCAAPERVRGDVERAPSERRREGRAEPEFHDGDDPAIAGAGGAMADPDIAEFPRQQSAGQQLQLQLQRDDELGLFPPGPADLDRWRAILARAPQLEPAVRRMADGMAARVDQLRMLGNGVVPLQAAYAIRVLATRLAARGSAGADELVSMMDCE